MRQLLDNTFQFIDAGGERDIFRADIIAPAAADAHMHSEAAVKIIDFVHGLEPHPLSVLFPERVSTRHIGKTVDMAPGPNPAAFG
jgi:hypothetical protein